MPPNVGPEPIRAGVLSAGAWSMHSHIPALLQAEQVDLVGVSTPSPQIATQVGQTWPELQVVADWRTLLGQGLDLVVVSSPPSIHPEQVVAALELGAAVLVEKPFAVSVADAELMAEAAGRSGGRLVVGFSWSSCEIFQLAKPFVPLLGVIDHVSAHLAVNTREVLGGAERGGWNGAKISSTATYTSAATSGGGAGTLSTSHLVAMVDWLTGLRPTSLVATRSPEAGEDDRVELHLSILARTAAAATLSLDTTSSQMNRAVPEWRITVHGSEGDLFVDTPRGRAEFTPRSGEAQLVEGSGKVDIGFPTRIAIDVARGAAVPLGLGHQLGLHTVAVAEAAYQSCATGRWTPVVG